MQAGRGLPYSKAHCVRVSKSVRQSMIEASRCRKLINQDVHRTRAMFRWATSQELYPGHRLHDLASVRAPEKGCSEAKDHPPVAEVDEAVVLATLPHLSPQVAAMVRLQLLTAARPGEVCSMRPSEVDRSGDVWIYRPGSHKTQHHGRERVIVIGPSDKSPSSRRSYRHRHSRRKSRRTALPALPQRLSNRIHAPRKNPHVPK
jgi:integrase